MVISGVTLRPETFKELKVERVRDSKKISPNRRNTLDSLIKSVSDDYAIVEFSAAEIDQLRAEGTNMNRIEVLGFARVLKELNPPKAYLDSASSNAEKFSSQIQEMLEDDIELIVEHKADENYLPVSAASIVSKVRRDKRIEELKEEYGETGSGYPSDERTIRFLERWMKTHKELPTFARKSWKTAQRIKSESEK